MRLLDLFSGIGGFSLAASWVWGDELDIVGFCEIDTYCHKVLNKNFPGVPIYKDITTLDGNQFKNIDIITGGFPCQDISIAGRGKSLVDEKTGETTRSGLWFEMLRVISEVRPRYALIENVPMLTVRGGVRVIADLTEIGYDASWTIVSAADVGAWHNRKRIWIVAHSGCEYGERNANLQQHESKIRAQNADQSKRSTERNRQRTSGRTENVSDSESRNVETGCEGFGAVCSEHSEKRASNNATSSSQIKKNVSDSRHNDRNRGRIQRHRKNKSAQSKRKAIISSGRSKATRSNERTKNVSDSNRKRRRGRQTDWKNAENARQLPRSSKHGYWHTEPELGRVANGIPNRVDRLKGLGNSIVPQCAYEIFKYIARKNAKSFN